MIWMCSTWPDGSEPSPVRPGSVLGGPILCILQVLESEGLAEVYPWNLHLYDMDLFYVAQFSAIQDCLYRHLWSSEYLLFGDVDELFVPREQPALMPILQTVFDKVSFTTKTALLPHAARFSSFHFVGSLSVSLSVCLSLSLSLSLSVSVSLFVSVCLHTGAAVCLSVCMYVYVHVCQYYTRLYGCIPACMYP